MRPLCGAPRWGGGSRRTLPQPAQRSAPESGITPPVPSVKETDVPPDLLGQPLAADEGNPPFLPSRSEDT